jgi:hypothetical protein
MKVVSFSYVGSKRIDISFGGAIIDIFVSSKPAPVELWAVFTRLVDFNFS